VTKPRPFIAEINPLCFAAKNAKSTKILYGVNTQYRPPAILVQGVAD